MRMRSGQIKGRDVLEFRESCANTPDPSHNGAIDMRNEPGRCTVGEYLARRLEQAGVRHYFTVPGDFNLILLDQLLKNPALQMIGCCNELNAGYAAEGYARSNGIGALVVTYSVGGLSALNAVACAYAEDLPVIAISGGINSDSEANGHVIHHALGEVRYDYQRQIYAHVTAGAFAIRRLEDAPAAIDRAIETALRCRKPVYLEIDCNLAAVTVPAPTARDFRPGSLSEPSALTAAVAHAADLLGNATRPVLVAGPRIRPPEAGAAFRKLADAAGYAVATQPAAKGMFPEDHPSFAGLYWGPVSSPGVAALVESADAYLFAGGLLTDYSTTGYSALIDAKKLLLANPDDVRLPGATYTGVMLADFLGSLAEKVRPNPGSLERFRRSHEVAPTGPDASDSPEPTARLTTRAVFAKVQSMLDGQSALLVETGDSWFNGLKARLPHGCHFEIQFQAGSIGWCCPATLGYELGCPAPTRVIAMIGDGSFQLTAQEVSTMVRYGVKPIIVLINNRGYTIEAEIHDGPYNRIKNWDYAGLMSVFNADDGKGLGIHAATVGELDAAMGRALAHDGPCLIEVPIDPHDCSEELREWGSRVAAANGRATRRTASPFEAV
jgi:TPP-dependent 2-oxoacid decarboxylase